MKHKLKTENKYFERVLSGAKTFEIRFNDRDFQVGDEVILLDYNNETKKCSGRAASLIITYVIHEFEAIKAGYCVFGFMEVKYIFIEV